MTIVEVYRQQARRRADAAALTFVREPHQGTVLTWRELVDRTCERADWLADHGVRPSNRCALVLADHPDLLPTLLAIWQRGAVVVPVDARWGGGLTSQVVAHSAVDAVVDIDARSIKSIPHGVDVAPLPPGTAMISYTSGSTADPKGVILGHNQLLAAYRRAAAGLDQLIGRRPRRLGCAMRMSGLGVLGIHYLWSAVLDCEVVVLPELTLATACDYWTALAHHRVELTYLVPPLVELVNRAAATPSEPARDVVCLAGGAALRPAAQQLFQQRFGAVLLNAYGLTEVSFAAFLGDRDTRGWGTTSIGRPVTVRARVRRSHGELVGDDAERDEAERDKAERDVAEGELELAGDVLCDGYYANPSATDELLRNGWLCTGDLVRRDGAGRYWVTGRVKDTVLKGAFTVYLNEVEEAAAALPGVTEAVALRLDLPAGEDIGLLIRLDDPRVVGPDTVRAAMVDLLGPDRAPRRVICVDESLPRIGQGKLDRRAALGLWWSLARRNQ